MSEIFNKIRIWLIMFICPKDITVIMNAKDNYLKRTIHIWGKGPVHFLKCSVSAPIIVHSPKVKLGFIEYVNAEKKVFKRAQTNRCQLTVLPFPLAVINWRGFEAISAPAYF